MKSKALLRSNLALGYSLARSVHFTMQQMSLPLIERLLSSRHDKKPNLVKKHLQKSAQELYQLLRKDSDNISRGIYPVEVLKPESLSKHALRYPKILVDGYFISKRRNEREAHEFNHEAREYMRDVPEYYQRNFHYQSGGYLTKKSAELYEHQVEILFSGAADAMRRLIIPLVKEVLPGDGEGLHFLEVGAGTGRLSRFMKLAFPKAKITLLDLSEPYLKKAQENLAEFTRMDFVQGAAEQLPFRDKQFDFVYSCFLFHELPLNVRRQVLEESLRTLKPGGYLGFVDSVQKQDAKDLEWALEQFPVDFHEPFYKNYSLTPMEDLISQAGFVSTGHDQGFFSKAILAQKPFSA